MCVDNLLNSSLLYTLVRNMNWCFRQGLDDHLLLHHQSARRRNLNFMDFLDGHLFQKRAEREVLFIHVQHWDIENRLNVHWLRSAAHQRGNWHFLNDHLLWEVEQAVQEVEIVHLFSHLQHWGIKGLDEFVPHAAVPLHPPAVSPLQEEVGRAPAASSPPSSSASG